MNKSLNLKAGCRTTAMGIMLHTDIEEALDDRTGEKAMTWQE